MTRFLSSILISQIAAQTANLAPHVGPHTRRCVLLPAGSTRDVSKCFPSIFRSPSLRAAMALPIKWATPLRQAAAREACNDQASMAPEWLAPRGAYLNATLKALLSGRVVPAPALSTQYAALSPSSWAFPWRRDSRLPDTLTEDESTRVE